MTDAVILIGVFGMFLVFPFLFGLCLLWAPFASAMCAVGAKNRGLSAKRYALAGGLYSLMLMLPWVYLVNRLAGNRLPRALVKWCYGLLYVFWLWMPIRSGYELIESAEGVFAPAAHFASLVSWINFATWAASLAWLAYVNGHDTTKAERWWEKEEGERFEPLPHLAYVQPFGTATLWALLILAVTYVGIATD